MTNQSTDLNVQAAIANAERMVRLEEGQGAILGHVERIDTHLERQNGRVGKAEQALADTTAALTAHLNQVTDRQEFSRLVGVEARVSAIEEKGKSAIDLRTGEALATKRFTAILAGGMVFAGAIGDMILKPLIMELLK